MFCRSHGVYIHIAATGCYTILVLVLLVVSVANRVNSYIVVLCKKKKSYIVVSFFIFDVSL